MKDSTAASTRAPAVASTHTQYRARRSDGPPWWAELLRRIYEVDPLTCPACSGPMRIVAFITERSVIERILAHLATQATRASAPGGRREARAPPSTRGDRRRRRVDAGEPV